MTPENLPNVTIRPATTSDISDIYDIYSDSVYNGTGTFAEVPQTKEQMIEQLESIQASGWPYLVAELPQPLQDSESASNPRPSINTGSIGIDIELNDIDTGPNGRGSARIRARGRVVGYAYVSQFRPRSAYRYCCEDSVYISPSARGKGVARALIERLINEAKEAGFITIMAIIGDSENAASIGLHAGFGFRHTGVMKDIGFKFGRWLDVVIMQLDIPGTGEKKAAMVRR